MMHDILATYDLYDDNSCATGNVTYLLVMRKLDYDVFGANRTTVD